MLELRPTLACHPPGLIWAGNYNLPPPPSTRKLGTRTPLLTTQSLHTSPPCIKPAVHCALCLPPARLARAPR